ncbi:MAG: hypothetical protein MZV63_19445 [Marinilabiliales bacterium]|nr:hypothetical protein [Marinilabiliales bacterium]
MRLAVVSVGPASRTVRRRTARAVPGGFGTLAGAAWTSCRPAVRGALWQCAYEHHYRDALINALANNHGRWTGAHTEAAGPDRVLHR